MAMLYPNLQLLAFFLALFLFHSSEFLLAVAFHGRSNVSSKSFLLSRQYVFAMVCGLIEYGVEGFLVPELKTRTIVSCTGLALMISGEVVRKLAILTAEHNFTHDIKIYHRENHELVTRGIYRFVRHPAYMGFFLWSVGTQVLLCNPICTMGYAVVTWRFFAHRIQFEEYFLRQFFGKKYEDYAGGVFSGIPFVK